MFSHPVYLFLREFSLQDFRGGSVRIRQNHHENKVRFVEGKHFFKVVGNDLKELRVALNYS
ncbi:hypothetical protein MMT79_29210, partial [Escherichia coli]|nr:hypothetical protein [Escherichia coli]